MYTLDFIRTFIFIFYFYDFLKDTKKNNNIIFASERGYKTCQQTSINIFSFVTRRLLVVMRIQKLFRVVN